MKNFKYEFEINDNFTKGDCYCCPLSYEQTYEFETEIFCSIGCNYNKCPLIEVNND